VDNSTFKQGIIFMEFMKIVARLRWKLPFLAEGYRLATLEISDVVSAEDLVVPEVRM
jgi:hypothetical protein